MFFRIEDDGSIVGNLFINEIQNEMPATKTEPSISKRSDNLIIGQILLARLVRVNCVLANESLLIRCFVLIIELFNI